MSEQEQVSQEEQVQETQVQEKNAIDVETYERTKNDMHKFKRQYMDTQSKLEEYEKKLQELEESKLKNSQNYKELWEKEREAKSKLEEKYQGFTKTVIEDRKLNAIKDEAVKRGLDTAWMDMLPAFDTSDVLVETTSGGNFQVVGADTWVEALKADRPMMFKQKSDPVVNNKSASSEVREKTWKASDVTKLQTEDPQKYQEIVGKISRGEIKLTRN